MDTKQALDLVNSAIASLKSNADLGYLLPGEIDLLEAIPFVPKQSVHYFNRQQALSLLMRFQLGIGLEVKVSKE